VCTRVRLLTIMISLATKVGPVAYRAWPERTPKSTTLQALFQTRNVDVLRKASMFKLLRKVLINMVLVVVLDEDHQVIVSISQTLAEFLVVPAQRGLTDQWTVLQNPCCPLLEWQTLLILVVGGRGPYIQDAIGHQ